MAYQVTLKSGVRFVSTISTTTSSTIANTKCLLNIVQRRSLPVNVPPTAIGKRRFRLSVETDPHKLVNYVCGLNYKKDQEPIKLGPDSDYPEWLWSLRLHAPKPSWELERGSKDYYERLALEGIERANRLARRQKKPKKVVGKQYLEQAEWLHHIRFRALAHLEGDYGIDHDKLIDQTIDNFDKQRSLSKSEFYLPPHPEKIVYKDKVPICQMLKHKFSIRLKQKQEFNSFEYKKIYLTPFTYKNSVNWKK